MPSSTRLSTRLSTPQCNLEKVALCTVRIQTPNEEKEGELTSQEVKSEEDYDSDDSPTLDDPNCTDEQKQEHGNRFGTNDDDLKLKRQLTDPDLPVFIGSVPDAEVGVLQKVILAIYSKFRERIQYLIAEYLKGNTAVTASIIGMTDEIFDTIRDLETLIGEFEEKQVEEGNADDYDKFLAELRKRFPEDKSLAESVKTLIFAEIRRHFALAAELEQLNNQIHSLRKKYSSTTEQQKRLDLCQRLKKIELETSVLEEKLDDLLVPEFVDQKKLKTNLDNLQRLINHYNAELEAESDQNGGAFIHQKLDDYANANWEKIVDINEEVQQTHEELNVLLEELEEDRGSTVKEMSDNLNLLDTLYEHKIKHTGKLIRNARHNCTADHFQSSKMLHKAEKLIQKLSTSQQRVGNALNILRKDLQEALDKKANESVFS
ncbi:hypothetical protein M3Y97_00325200 [Aphelenchoides bicaudatus]|nr:hypothetical protein M3Y97_00325200 [Aphelenchoides bicaudatus]